VVGVTGSAESGGDRAQFVNKQVTIQLKKHIRFRYRATVIPNDSAVKMLSRVATAIYNSC